MLIVREDFQIVTVGRRGGNEGEEAKWNTEEIGPPCRSMETTLYQQK